MITKKKLIISGLGISILVISILVTSPLLTAKQTTEVPTSRVLIGFKGYNNANAIQVIESFGGTVTTTFQFVSVVGAIVPTAVMKSIEKSNGITDIKVQAVATIQSVGEVGSTAIESHLDIVQETPYGIDMVNAPEVWNMGYTGDNVRVVVMDTGIDADHPNVPENYNPDLSYDFVDEDNDPDDHDGHGTHVSATIAAPDNGIGVVGVAPDAEIVMLRVCGEDGFCHEDDMMQAIEYAMMIDADVLTMSIGGVGFVTPGSGPATTGYKHLFTMAYGQGILITASAGNSGTQSAHHFPSGFSEVMAVGAVDSNKQLAGFSTYGPKQEVVAPGVNVLSNLPVGFGTETSLTELSPTLRELQANSMSFSGLGDVTAELVYGGLGSTPGGFGDPSIWDFDNDGVYEVDGKIALIQRGAYSFLEKAYNALLAGAIGVIIFNQNPGNFFGTLQVPFSWPPVVSISNAEGLALLAEVGEDNSGSVTVHLVIEASNYGYLSGTSMAAPHVAGVAALVMSANSDLSNKDVRKILTTTTENLGNPGQRDIYYGWGLVDALAAVMAATP